MTGLRHTFASRGVGLSGSTCKQEPAAVRKIRRRRRAWSDSRLGSEVGLVIGV